MRISSLSETILFERNETVKDENGNHMNKWRRYFSCHAAVESSSYQQTENLEAGTIVAENSLVFTVRYCSELANLDTTHFRVRFHGDPYNITAIDMMGYGHQTMQISCERERRKVNG